MNELFPLSLNSWNEKTILNLIELKIEENELFDYKEQFFNGNKSYKKELVNTITSFSNSKGGFLIFGINDKFEIKGIELNDKIELNLTISQQLQECTPQISFEVKTIIIETKKIIVLKIEESDNKPVQSIDKAFYIRLNGQSIPISRDYLRDLFLTKDIKNQKKEALLFEIDYMIETIKSIGKLDSSPILPPFYQFRTNELQKAVSDYQGYFKEGGLEIIKQLNRQIADFKKEETFFKFLIEIELSRKIGHYWNDLNGFLQHNSVKFSNVNQRLSNILKWFEHLLNEIKKYI